MKNLIAIIVVLTPFMLSAQDTLITEQDTIITGSDVIEVDQVEVIKAFEAKLDDAQKISLSPKVEPIVPVEKSYDYSITIVPLPIDYPDPIIRPLAMNPDPVKPVSQFYSRIGYGDLNSPFADMSYHSKRGDELDYTISGHFYGADDSENIMFQKFYESDLNMNVGYRLGENHKLSIDLAGGYDQRNLYDTLVVNTNTITDEAEVQRNVPNIHAHFGIQNIEPTGANFNYGIGLSAQYIQLDQMLEYSERGLGMDLFIENRLSSKFVLALEADGAIENISYVTGESRERNAVSFNPGFRLALGNFQLDAAADIFIDDRQTSPFAKIRAAYSLSDNSLQLYAGVDQVAIANTLWNHYENNPFVSGFLEIDKTTLSQQYYAGLSGKLRDFVTFNFMAGYADVQDQFYYDNFANFRMFVKHTDMTNLFINANIEFNLTEKVSLGANVSQNFYDPEDIESLPNMPEFNYSGYSKIKFWEEKLVVSAELNLMDRIFYTDNFSTEFLGNSQIDFSVGVDFFITENVGLWVRANNLLDRAYLRFNGYPEFGRNFLGGLFVKF